jgi:hypothetical protein
MSDDGNSAERFAFDAAIERHLRWRLAVFASWLGVLPLEMIVGWPLTKLTGTTLPFTAVALTCMAVFAFSGLKVGMFTCPRCHQPFARKRHFTNPFTSSCLNCGLTHTR